MSAPTTRPFTQVDLDRLHAALLDAYATLDDLARLVRNDLAANLETMVVVHGRDLAKITADLIRACCTSDARLHQLVNVAAAQRADHPALPALAADWAAIRFTDLERFILAPPDSSRRLYVNVPPMPPHFLGRTALLDALIDRLISGQSTAGSIAARSVAALSTDGLP
ncbi:MAG: hypothetical protein KDA37_06710, partial [Planctomycetales bacterium]|nr:hypothetical protein [Planctomycetales bacterium]